LQENDSMLSEVLAGTTQGPTVTVVSEAAKATSQPAATSAGTSALPPWMSIVPSSAAQTPAVGSDCKSFATTPTLPLTLLGPSSSASREVPSSTSGDIATSSIPPPDPTSTVLAQRYLPTKRIISSMLLEVEVNSCVEQVIGLPVKEMNMFLLHTTRVWISVFYPFFSVSMKAMHHHVEVLPS
jgi:hypothetical protein